MQLHLASRSAPILAVLSAAACSCVASAELIAFDEARDGDASDDRFSPTMVSLAGGVNTIRGSFGQSPTIDVHDLDYITFTVPEGFQLESFMLQTASVGGAFSFVGLQAGPIIAIPADWTSIETPLLGWAHFGTADVGQDLLEYMRVSPGSVGFSGPLSAGTYALWIMELDTSEPHTYSFGLGVSAIPAPSVLAVPIAWALLPRRRDRRFTAN